MKQKPVTRWAYNAATGEIFSYSLYPDGRTEFKDDPVYGSYIISGLKSREGAVSISKQYGKCPTCQHARFTNDEGKCWRCGGEVTFHQIREE